MSGSSAWSSASPRTPSRRPTSTGGSSCRRSRTRPGLRWTCSATRERIRVANRRGPWQEVAILGFKLAELDTPAFRKFLKEAVESFQAAIGKMQTSPEDVMPWKLNGERWHLGEKGFPPGYKVKWERAILPRLLEVVKESVTDVTVQWDNRLMLTLHSPACPARGRT